MALTYVVSNLFLIITGRSDKALRDKAYEYRKESVAESTKRSRRIQWDCYVRTCDKFGWDPLPCTVDQACMYVTFLADKMKVSSIITYYQAVVFMHTCNGLEPVNLSNPILKATIKGIGNVEGRTEVGKDPIFPKDLLAISKVVDVRSYLEVVVFTAMLFLFRTLLRVSHVVKSDHTTSVGDIKFNANGFLLAVRTAKNLKSNERVMYIPVGKSQDTRICAVTWLRKMLVKSDEEGNTPLFTDKSGCCLSYSTFSNVFKVLVRKAKLIGDFASHSLRRGGATHMSMQGCSIAEVRDRGGWKSDCVYRYIHQPIRHKVAVDRKFIS